jgi:hypothetical protein
VAREGHLDADDRPDKSGVIADFSQLTSGRIELNLTMDDPDTDVGER